MSLPVSPFVFLAADAKRELARITRTPSPYMILVVVLVLAWITRALMAHCTCQAIFLSACLTTEPKGAATKETLQFR